MYLKKLTIENIRALKRFEMTFPENPAGWHVIIGDNGAGKSTVIRAISLGLIGPNEVRAAHPDFGEWLRKGARNASVTVVVRRDFKYDHAKGSSKARELTAKVLLQPNNSLSRLAGGTPLVEAMADEKTKPDLTKYLWSNSQGWFSAGFGSFRRFTGGDEERNKVFHASPRCGAHLSVFGEDVALTEALLWLQEIDYRQLKAKEAKALKAQNNVQIIENENLSTESDDDLLNEVRRLWELARQLQDRSLFKEAESLYRRALKMTETRFGSGAPSVASSLNNLALLLQETNQLKEAESLMRRALVIGEASFGLNAPSVATSLNNLALLLRETNRLAEAEPLMRRALAIDEANFGSDHPEVAIDLNNLALLLQSTNRLAEAEPLMRRALAIGEASFGPDHPKVAIRLNNLAQLLKATNRLAEAEPLMRRALAIDEASFGPDHPSVARDLNNLAQLLQATNRRVEAEPLMRRALAIDEASFGPDHPKVAIELSNLAGLLQDTKRLAEAEPLVRRALAISEASFGPDHPDVALALNNLAQLLQATNRLTEAEPLMRRALAIGEASFGPDHPEVAVDLNNLAGLLQATNRMTEAEPLMRRALAISEASFGPDHPTVAIRLNNLAGLLQDTKRMAEAEPLIHRALTITEASFGPDHPDVAIALNNLVQLLLATDRAEEARKLMQQYQAKIEALSPHIAPAIAKTDSSKPPLPDDGWLALSLRTFINQSQLLPSGTAFKGMSAEGPVFRDGNGQTLVVTQLSDGFRSVLSLSFELIRQLIRVYGLLKVFPASGTHGVIDLPGIVLIDEVDIHLHPTWQTRIGQTLTRCFPKMQFIVTTHSPLICRAVTETTGSIWRLPTPGQGEQVEEVTGVMRDRLRLGTVLDAYGTGLFGGAEVEQPEQAVRELEEMAELDGKQLFGKTTPEEDQRLKVLRQRFSTYDTATHRRA